MLYLHHKSVRHKIKVFTVKLCAPRSILFPQGPNLIVELWRRSLHSNYHSNPALNTESWTLTSAPIERDTKSNCLEITHFPPLWGHCAALTCNLDLELCFSTAQSTWQGSICGFLAASEARYVLKEVSLWNNASPRLETLYSSVDFYTFNQIFFFFYQYVQLVHADPCHAKHAKCFLQSVENVVAMVMGVYFNGPFFLWCNNAP